jgi:hypothetical protein
MEQYTNLIVFTRRGKDDAERAVGWIGEALGLREVAFLEIDGMHMWGCHSGSGGQGASVGWKSGSSRVHIGLPADWKRRWATLRECAIDAARAIGCVLWFCDPTEPPQPETSLCLMHEVQPDGSVGPLRHDPDTAPDTAT